MMKNGYHENGQCALNRIQQTTGFPYLDVFDLLDILCLLEDGGVLSATKEDN